MADALKFNRKEHSLRALRPFQHGTMSFKEGEVLKPEEIAKLSDDDVGIIVHALKVAEPVPAEAAAASDGEAKAKA